MLRSSLFLIFILSCLFCKAQEIVIDGKVTSLENEELPFVNIGIPGKAIGTVTDIRGLFSLKISEKNLDDTLSFSLVGFNLFKQPISLIISDKIKGFKLSSKIFNLKEVEVISKGVKKINTGTKTHNPFLYSYAQRDEHQYDIQEFAKYIKVRRPSKLIDANLFLNIVSGDTAVFRINFYSVKNGLPGDRLVEKSIIITTGIKLGWLKINLSEYNIQLQNDFFISYELLPSKEERKGTIRFGNQFGGAFYSRDKSFGTWDKFSGATLSSYVTILQ